VAPTSGRIFTLRKVEIIFFWNFSFLGFNHKLYSYYNERYSLCITALDLHIEWKREGDLYKTFIRVKRMSFSMKKARLEAKAAGLTSSHL
jgi:hypothetical protein